MSTYKFAQIDAFSSKPLYGNPAAVVFDADDLPKETMQKIAKEMNLSETVFFVKPTDPDADYKVRIFTPKNELPFAGHPTVAAAHAVLTNFEDKSSKSLLQQECGIGLVPVEVLPQETGGPVLRMTQGTPTFTKTAFTKFLVAKMLGTGEANIAADSFEVVSTGVRWIVVELTSFEAISKLDPDYSLIKAEASKVSASGITVFVGRPSGPADIRVRTFAPVEGVLEDPVCGSGNGSVCAFIAKRKNPEKLQGSYQAEQGVEIGRDGSIHASWDRRNGDFKVLIGGQAVSVLSGELHL